MGFELGDERPEDVYPWAHIAFRFGVMSRCGNP